MNIPPPPVVVNQGLRYRVFPTDRSRAEIDREQVDHMDERFHISDREVRELQRVNRYGK